MLAVKNVHKSFGKVDVLKGVDITVNKGDVVVIERKIKNYDDIKIGQIMAVKHENIIVVHRLVKKIKSSDEMYYYTKGDANNDIDNFKITKKDIYGIVNTKIPYIGLPTVWLRDL